MTHYTKNYLQIICLIHLHPQKYSLKEHNLTVFIIRNNSKDNSSSELNIESKIQLIWFLNIHPLLNQSKQCEINKIILF